MAWNRPCTENQQTKANAKAPSVKRGILAGAMVVAVLGGFCLYLFTNGEATSSSLQKKERGLIKEVTPAAAPKAVEEPVPVKPKKKYWEVDASQTNGFTEAMRLKWVHEHMPKPGHTNDTSRYETKPKYAIFDYPCENIIASYLSRKPGDMLVGEPVFGQKFVDGFLESLKAPIIVKADDEPYVKELKRLMIETKIDLKARYDAGEDISQIMSDTHKELRKLSMYKTNIEIEYTKFKRNPDATLADVEDFITAANAMLDAKGIAPMQMSPVTKRMLMRREEAAKVK